MKMDFHPFEEMEEDTGDLASEDVPSKYDGRIHAPAAQYRVTMTLFNSGMSLNSSFEELIGGITGGSPDAPLYAGAIVLVIFSAVYAIYSPLQEQGT